MIDLIMIYIFIVCVALVNWVYSRFCLHVKLSHGYEMFKISIDSESTEFYTKYAKTLLITLVFLVFEVFLVGFCLFRLLYLLGVNCLELSLVTLVLMCFYANDRYFYKIAMFVMNRSKR